MLLWTDTYYGSIELFSGLDSIIYHALWIVCVCYNKNSQGYFNLGLCQIFITLSSALSGVDGRIQHKLTPLLWTFQGSIFTGGTLPPVQLNLGEQLDLICRPYKDPVNNRTIPELSIYNIYLVTRDSYDKCDTSDGKRVFHSDGKHERRFTVVIRRYTPIPFGLEFECGHDYYFLTTWNITKERKPEIMRTKCLFAHLRLHMYVRCPGEMTTGRSNSAKFSTTVYPAVESLEQSGSNPSSLLNLYLALLIMLKCSWMILR